MKRKTALVTGGRKGIGRAIAQSLAEAGFYVIITGRGPKEAAEATLAEFAAAGLHVQYRQCDSTLKSQREALLSDIREQLGRLDVHVNNSGVAPQVRADILETTEESYDRVLDTNLKAAFFWCQAAAREMLCYQQESLEDYHPRIINISSVSSYAASVNRGEYCISKAGISMVTQLFALRLAQHNIPVFEVAPGIIRTDMTGPVSEQYEKRIREGLTPVPRMGEPQDVADCVMAAVSGKLDFAAGQVLHADGGFHLRSL